MYLIELKSSNDISSTAVTSKCTIINIAGTECLRMRKLLVLYNEADTSPLWAVLTLVQPWPVPPYPKYAFFKLRQRPLPPQYGDTVYSSRIGATARYASSVFICDSV